MSMEFAVRRYGWIRLDVCFSFFFSIYCVLKPFIDVGVDWIDSPYCVSIGLPTGVKLEHDAGKAKPDGSTQGKHPVPLHEVLSTTPWSAYDTHMTLPTIYCVSGSAAAVTLDHK